MKAVSSFYTSDNKEDKTISTASPIGIHLNTILQSTPATYLIFNKERIQLVEKITIGREADNDVVINNKLASRHHAVIQKIKDAFFIKDLDSTNGTYVNGELLPKDKYVRLAIGDKVTIGSASIIIA